MEKMTPPTLNPLATQNQSQQVYVALIPGMPADPASHLTIVSGFSADEDAKVHRLSRLVLHLAMINCFVTVTMRLVGLIIALAYAVYSQIGSFFINITFAMVVMYLGIRGVKTRNAPCFPFCCGPLTAFYVTYVILAIIEAFAVIIALIEGFVVLVLLDVFFLALYAVTAEQARRLLEALALLPEEGAFTTAVAHQMTTSGQQKAVITDATQDDALSQKRDSIADV